jgi:hypothetical protein
MATEPLSRADTVSQLQQPLNRATARKPGKRTPATVLRAGDEIGIFYRARKLRIAYPMPYLFDRQRLFDWRENRVSLGEQQDRRLVALLLRLKQLHHRAGKTAPAPFW